MFNLTLRLETVSNNSCNSNRYDEVDALCCEWIDSVIDTKFKLPEHRSFALGIKSLLINCKEKLERYRGHYIVFKDGKMCDNYYEEIDDALQDGLDGAYVFFVPTEEKYRDNIEIIEDSRTADLTAIKISDYCETEDCDKVHEQIFVPHFWTSYRNEPFRTSYSGRVWRRVRNFIESTFSTKPKESPKSCPVSSS